MQSKVDRDSINMQAFLLFAVMPKLPAPEASFSKGDH